MKDNIKICTWNLCLGARCKLPLIKELLLENSIDVLCLQEVEINKQDDMNIYNIENFSVEFEGVTDGFKIRTLIYVSNRLQYRRMTELEKDNSHIVALKLIKQGIILASLYRTYQLTTHHSHLSAFEEQILVLKNICDQNLKTIIMGDFNLDQMRRNDRSYHHSRLYEVWKNFETEHTLLQLVTFTTWARAERGVLKTSLLDHIYANNKSIIDTIEELAAVVSDHSPVLATLTSNE